MEEGEEGGKEGDGRRMEKGTYPYHRRPELKNLLPRSTWRSSSPSREHK
jgi:hypothetical protein